MRHILELFDLYYQYYKLMKQGKSLNKAKQRRLETLHDRAEQLVEEERRE